MKANSFWNIVTFATLATAANTVEFVNKCPYNVWFWTVGPAGSNINGYDYERIMVPGNGGSVIHGMVNTEALGGGLALKMRDLPRYQVGPVGILQVEYHLEPSTNSFWYDFSAINCRPGVGPEDVEHCPVLEGGIKIYVPSQTVQDACPPAFCKDGICHNTYQEHGSWKGEPSFKCPIGRDLMVEMCTEHAGHQTHDDAVPKPAVVASPDGLCGVDTRYTCKGSRFGRSCSAYGYCGDGESYFGAGCQPDFGACSEAGAKVSSNGVCGGSSGLSCAKSLFGSCCSQYNYCGDTDEFCGKGCQSAFGDCGNSTSRSKSVSIK